MTGAEIARRARSLVGIPFRPQGRSAEHGLDCIGVAALATDTKSVRSDYALRFADFEAVHRDLAGRKFERIDAGDAGEGDLVLVRAGPAQLHMLVLTGSGFVHADLRLRRVVEAPGSIPWPVLSAWRRFSDRGSEEVG